MEIPILRLEMENMKLGIIRAFSEYQVSLDANVRTAVEAFCTPSHLNNIINQAVDDTLKRAIKDEIEKYYTYGEGRRVIAEAVIAKLRESQ